jgi:hypothetical protein
MRYSYACSMSERLKIPLGPRGGQTTRKKGQVKKSIWLNVDEAEALREASFKRRTSEVSIVREALRKYLRLPD